METPRVLVLLNCYFNVDLIERTVISILETKYPCDIIFLENPSKYSDDIRELVKKYNIESNLVSIICASNYNDDIKVIDNCFFIIKNVPDYTSQFENNKTDNNFEWLEYGMNGINFEKEYEIIKNNFDLSNLLNKEEV